MFALFLTGLGVSLLPGQLAVNELVDSQHWIALAAVVVATERRGPGAPRLASLTPMLLASQGLGALVLGATIAGKALLEPGARARLWLVAALAMLGLASVLDAQLLWLWELTGSLLQLSADSASLVARLLVEGTRLAGWGAILRWSFGPGPYSSPSPS